MLGIVTKTILQPWSQYTGRCLESCSNSASSFTMWWNENDIIINTVSGSDINSFAQTSYQKLSESKTAIVIVVIKHLYGCRKFHGCSNLRLWSYHFYRQSTSPRWMSYLFTFELRKLVFSFNFGMPRKQTTLFQKC